MNTFTTDHISADTLFRLAAQGVALPKPIPDEIRELHAIACYFASVNMQHESGVCSIEIARLWRGLDGTS